MERIEFVTTNDLAKKYNIAKSTVAFWVTQGLIIPRGTLGKAKYFNKTYAEKRVAELLKERS
jgi:DNA-binding transcriptional MerR regulator